MFLLWTARMVTRHGRAGLGAPPPQLRRGVLPLPQPSLPPSAATTSRRGGAAAAGRPLVFAAVKEAEAEAGAAASAPKFSDPRWKNGTWDLVQFTTDGKTQWDAVIDAEVLRRKWLEDNPESSTNDDPVLFESSQVPWWAWTRRFHLPEAEKLNGRAAMVGYFAAYVVDSATGVGLVDQQSSFLGKLLLFLTVVGVLLIRKTDDVNSLKGLADEWTFYDRQWEATWKEGKRPSDGDKPAE
eukprot:SM000114S24133  [mRNA]  locus=s114:121990:124455:- [translate_table: standard]